MGEGYYKGPFFNLSFDFHGALYREEGGGAERGEQGLEEQGALF